MKCSFKTRFVIEKVVENRILNEEMYLKTKIAVFLLVVTLNLQIIPAERLSGSKFSYFRYDNASRSKLLIKRNNLKHINLVLTSTKLLFSLLH